MNFQRVEKPRLGRAGAMLAALFLISALTAAAQPDRSVLVVTSTNNANGNAVVVFRLNTGAASSLTYDNMMSTGGNGGAGGNAGIVQFKNDIGAVANYGSNTVSQLVRYDDFIAVGNTIRLAPGCTKPDSVALTQNYLFVVGVNCAETHAWPSGKVAGPVVSLADPSAAQIAVGKSWAAVTMTSGSVLQLPLAWDEGVLNGTSAAIALPSNANNTPLGEAFWNDILGFNPAHSPDSFAIVNKKRQVFPVAGPTPSYPGNAPCWLAKGPGNAWYSGNSPGQAISIFFSDDQGGEFYKSISLPGVPTDITVSRDRKWLAVIYAAGGQGYVAVYSVDAYGGLTWVATSNPVGVASFSGVAISE